MRKVLGIIALSSCVGFSQSEFSVPFDTKILDISGGHFLGYILAEDGFVSEYDGNGDLIWEGSTTFFGGSDGLYLYPPVPFIGTDEVLFIMTRDINSIDFSDDSSQYQFIKIDLSDQSIVQEATDTFFSHSITPVVFNDSAIFLFQKFVDGSPDLTEVMTINNDLTINSYTAADSIISYFYVWDKYFLHDGGIFRIQNVAPFSIQSDFYSLPFSLEGATELISMPYGGAGDPADNNVFFMDTVGIDSLLIVYESSYSGSSIREWTFILADYNLNILASENITAPGSKEIRSVTATNTELFILMKHLDPESTNPEGIQVYDFEFNFVCPFSTLFPASDNNALSFINNSAYFKRKNGSSDDYYQIDVCGFTSGMSQSTLEIELDVFPNPASDYFTIALNGQGSTEQLNFVVKNVLGQKIFDGGFNGTDAVTIDVSRFAPGTYLIQLDNDGDIHWNSKIIIQPN